MRRHCRYGGLLAAVAALLSCEHKELYHSVLMPLSVRFDWQDAPDADPAAMELFCFPEDSSAVQHIQLQGREGDTVYLAGGRRYRMLAFSGDSEVLTYAELPESMERFCLSCRSTHLLSSMDVDSRAPVPKAEGTEEQKVIREIDRLWASGVEEVNLPLAKHAVQEVTLTPADKALLYEVTIRDCSGLSYVYAVSATLSGLSSGYFPGIQTVSDDQCVIPFPLEKAGEDRLHGALLTLGHRDAGPFILSIYAVIADGAGYVYPVDVTGQVLGAENPAHVQIEINGLRMPEPKWETFSLSVDSWNLVREFIKM